MVVTYFHHSGFMIELPQAVLLFDYIQGDIGNVREDKAMYVFVSHRHEDHYNDIIFSLREKYHPTYILSDDIHCQTQADMHYICANSNWSDDIIQVKTLTSTDEGVAFIVQVEDKKIYFAGDLNWWDWGSEDSVEEAKDMKQRYDTEMRKIKGIQFDVAFLPVDPRLQERYKKGAQLFFEYASAKHIFLMHFWNTYEMQAKFRKEVNITSGVLHNITRQDESFYCE